MMLLGVVAFIAKGDGVLCFWESIIDIFPAFCLRGPRSSWTAILDMATTKTKDLMHIFGIFGMFTHKNDQFGRFKSNKIGHLKTPRNFEYLFAPKGNYSPATFMLAARHRCSRQYEHQLRRVLSITQFPPPAIGKRNCTDAFLHWKWDFYSQDKIISMKIKKILDGKSFSSLEMIFNPRKYVFWRWFYIETHFSWFRAEDSMNSR